MGRLGPVLDHLVAEHQDNPAPRVRSVADFLLGAAPERGAADGRAARPPRLARDPAAAGCGAALPARAAAADGAPGVYRVGARTHRAQLERHGHPQGGPRTDPLRSLRPGTPPDLYGAVARVHGDGDRLR